jgi:hypothetical protein
MKTVMSFPVMSVLAGIGLWLAASEVAVAQQEPEYDAIEAEPLPPSQPAAEPPPRIDYDSEPPYTHYERQWNRRFPAPYRRAFRKEYYPYGRPYYPRRHWGARLHDRYDYRYDSYGPYYDDPYVFDDGYMTGFHDGRRFQKWETKAELGRSAYLRAMRAGVDHFRKRDYSTAARQFIMAAELNQGDAAARLHAVHALTALGHYSAAVPALRRALQLQPKIVYLPLDIRTEYGAVADFEAHVAKLARSARELNDDAGLWLLLGYYHFFSGSMPQAHQALSTAAELAPDDEAIQRLLDVAELSVPPAPDGATPSTTRSPSPHEPAGDTTRL